jgi:RNA polymerase sigma factor (sigma-70 family)
VPDHSTEISEYSKFYKENVERLIAFLMLQGWTRLDAADCVQETLIAALPPTWSTIENPVAWCRKVAYRKACDLLKRDREEPVDDLERAGTPLIVPGTELNDLEQGDRFLYWLKQLSGHRQREVMVWTWDGATPAEIAAALDLNPATVRSVLRDARAALRRLREEGGHTDG